MIRIQVTIDGQSIDIHRDPITMRSIDDPAEVAWRLLGEAVEDVRRALRLDRPAPAAWQED